MVSEAEKSKNTFLTSARGFCALSSHCRKWEGLGGMPWTSVPQYPHWRLRPSTGHRGRLETHSVTLFELKLSASWSVSCNSCPSPQHHVAAYHHTSPRVMMDYSTSYWAEINPSSFKLSLQIFWHHSVGCNQCSSNVIMLHWGLPGREAIAHP